MATKYYHAANANRGLIGGARFTVYGIFAGSAFGVYATDDAGEQGSVASEAAVTEIDLAEYEACIKKKPQPTDIISTLSKQPPLNGAPSIKGAGAAVVKDDGQEPEGMAEVKTSVETVDQALELAEAKPGAAAPKPALPKNRVKGQKEDQ